MVLRSPAAESRRLVQADPQTITMAISVTYQRLLILIVTLAMIVAQATIARERARAITIQMTVSMEDPTTLGLCFGGIYLSSRLPIRLRVYPTSFLPRSLLFIPKKRITVL